MRWLFCSTTRRYKYNRRNFKIVGSRIHYVVRVNECTVHVIDRTYYRNYLQEAPTEPYENWRVLLLNAFLSFVHEITIITIE
jgi:hypothetical protein